MLAYVLDTDVRAQAILEDMDVLEWRRPFFGFGSFRLQLNFNHRSAKVVQRGLLLAPSIEGTGKAFVPDHVFLIEELVYGIDETGAANETILASGRDIAGMLEERLIIPPTGLEFDERTDFAETVMKGYVLDHAGENATAARQMPGLVVVSSVGRGDKVTYQGRYQTVNKALSEIGQQQNLGWEISLDTSTGDLLFDCLEGSDHSQGSAHPVYLDIELNTLRSLEWTRSDLGYKNLAVVAGKGEGAQRDVLTRFISPTESRGFQRREAFVDGQDATDIETLALKAEAFLEGFSVDLVTAELPAAGPFRYRRDFDLGDLVTVHSRKWGLKNDVQIVGVSLRYESSASYLRTRLELGRPMPTIAARIRQASESADAGRRR